MSSTVSVREDIIQYFMSLFNNLSPGMVINGETITSSFDVVTRMPIRGSEASFGLEISMSDWKERKKPLVGYDDCFLLVTTEFCYRVELGADPVQEANRVLSDIQIAMKKDVTCGGIAMNVVEQSNELDTDSGGAHIVSGIVYWEVRYRTVWNDVRRRIGH